MLAYWCLYDLFLELTRKDGVLLVGERIVEVDLGVIVDEVGQALGTNHRNADSHAHAHSERLDRQYTLIPNLFLRLVRPFPYNYRVNPKGASPDKGRRLDMLPMRNLLYMPLTSHEVLFIFLCSFRTRIRVLLILF
jgi:hypothetical protein